jgi:hypothetical protein
MGFEALEAQAQEHAEVTVERTTGAPAIEEDQTKLNRGHRLSIMGHVDHGKTSC